MKPIGVPLVLLTAFTGCEWVLPFDSLSGGVRPGGPTPAALYRFEEQSGTTVADSVGAHPGELDGDQALPTWTADGKRGGGLAFGTDGSVYVPSFSGAGFPQKGTVAMWVFLKDAPPTGAEAVFFAPAETDDFVPLALYVQGNGLTFERNAGATSEELLIASFDAGTWYLVAAGWDTAAGKAIVFARPDGRPALPLQTGDLPPDFVLKSPFFSVSARDGTIDEVRVYGHLLSLEELEALE